MLSTLPLYWHRFYVKIESRFRFGGNTYSGFLNFLNLRTPNRYREGIPRNDMLVEYAEYLIGVLPVNYCFICLLFQPNSFYFLLLIKYLHFSI